ncbi:iron complex outermembrane recepter protein [Pseudarcicella hirudinis]|uniref:Iron complex outermembrane recepter protein n=1 Tax=Pseudarcicella hirudinis TaxID=1079859 RepID=A0A1I5U0I4_9BACT|nr:SusC/RagA family TonB-linked outer membrane protein [Pseudarcicella hirudinis]SFP88367.1 iron complex outermembrane recepter protein [Pseudarcicella hirudinis]
MKSKFTMFIISLLFLSWQQVYAQQHVIKGKVSDNNQSGLPGVNILVKGTTKGTTSDADGNYSISASKGAVLVFSSVGYSNKEVAVKDQSVINITLDPSDQALDEVVVTALGIKKETKALGYAVSTVSAKDITASGNTNFASALYGKAAGVKITTAPGGATSGVNVQVRGINSLNYNTQPLYVVDGIVIRDFNQAGAGGLNNGGYWSDQKIRGNGILDINPADISSLTVLKGASATALYGSEAANGVIVITTKTGVKGKGLGVEVNYTYNEERVAFTPQYQNVYGPGYDRATNLQVGANEDGFIIGSDGSKRVNYRAYGQFGPKMDGQMLSWWDGTKQAYTAKPDNYNQFYQTGYNSTMNAAFSNATDKASYRFSYTGTDYQGIMRGSSLKRNTFNLNTSLKLSDRVTADIIVSYVNSTVHNRPEQINRVTANYGGFFSRAEDMNNFLNRYQTSKGYKYVMLADKQRNPDEAFKYNIRGGDLMDLLWNGLKNSEDEVQDRLLSSVTLNYKISKEFSLRGRMGNDFTSLGVETKKYNEYPILFNGSNSTGEYRLQSGRYSIVYGDAMLTYNKSLNKDLDLTASGGMQGRQEKYYDQSIGTNGGLVIENWFSMNNSTNLLSSSANRKELLKYAYIGTANLAYKNMLFFEGTARKEFSSTLPAKNNNYFYYSFNSGFVFSDAFQMPSFLNYGKVRASYGVVGNAPPLYVANTTYSQTILQTGNGAVPALSANSSYGNDYIRPEQKYESEFGLETKLFNNKLGFDLTYYTSRIEDQILQTDVPTSIGAASVLTNVGELGSRGWEVSLYSTPVRTKDFSWNTRINIANNRTTVHKLAAGINQLVAYNADGGALKIVSDEGDLLGNIYTHTRATDKNGNFIITDDGLYKMTTDYKKVGNVMPTVVGGFLNTFNYKGFSLDLTVDYRLGGQLVSSPLLYATGAGMFENTMQYRDEANGGLPYYVDNAGKKVLLSSHSAAAPNGARVYHDGVLLDGVTESGDKNTRIVEAAYYYMNSFGWSTGWYEKGAVYDNSFVKMREAVLSYTIPNKVAQKLHLQNIRVSLVGRNLFYIWRTLKNLDPEAPIGTSWNRQGVDEGSSAATRSFGFSLHASF